MPTAGPTGRDAASRGPHRVVIVGAGFGGINAARALDDPRVHVTILDRNNFHTFQPLLYQVATAGLNAADVAYAVRGIFQRQQNVDFLQGEVRGVDWDRRSVLLDGDELPLDRLIVAAGSRAGFFDVPGAEEHALPLYELADAARLRNHVLTCFEEAARHPALLADGLLDFVVVGGGPTGVEVAGALAELIDEVLRRDFHTLDVTRATVTLLEQADVLLAPFSDRSRRFALQTLQRRGVTVRFGTAVRAVAPDRVELASGEVLRTRTLVWAAGVRAAGVAALLDVPLGRGGRIRVGPDLAIDGHADAFAIGDVADIATPDGARLPQLAQVAIQGGRHAAAQILADLDGRPRTPFAYRDKGTMATIGRHAAVAELPGGRILTGAGAWFAWLGLHLLYLMGMRNRVSVLVNWAWSYATWDRGPRLIFGGAAARRTALDGADP